MVTKGEALQMLGFGSLLSSAFEGERQQQWETVAGRGALSSVINLVQIPGSWTLTPVYLLCTSRELGFLSPCQCPMLKLLALE